MGAPKREGDDASGGNSTKRVKREQQSSTEQNGAWTMPHDIVKQFPDWGRPKLDTAANGDISFQQLDLDKTIEYGDSGEPRAVIRIFGTDEKGASIACYVQNFKPYFFVKAPKGLSVDDLGAFRDQFNRQVMSQIKAESRFKGLTKAVLDAELVKKENIYGYSSRGKETYVKVTIALWTLMTPCRNVAERGFEVDTTQGTKKEQFSTFESNIDFEVRFMVDRKIKGASWLTLPGGKYGDRLIKETTCSYECTIDYRHIIAHEPDGDWSRVAPLRILSYDIECAGRKGIFPEPEHDPVIQIAAMVQRQGQFFFFMDS